MNIDRVNSELTKQIGYVLNFKLKDPRISGMLTVTEVNTTRDLKYATVYVSYYGDPEKKKATFETLNHCAGFIRNEVKDMVRIRLMPTLIFKPDDSSEYAQKMDQLINKAKENMVYFEDDVSEEESTDIDFDD